MNIQPYLHFDGRCEEAIEFYKSALGAKVEMLLRMKDSPEQPPPGTVPPGSENKVMHAALRIGDSIVLASDGQCSGKAKFDGFNLTLDVGSDAEVERLFNALNNGGTVRMPLTRTFFASKFGMVQDRFGVGWIVINQSK